MLKYICRLPNSQKVNAAVISTNGKISTRIRDGYQGWALHQARLYLKFKNYEVFFSDTLDYPHNITVVIPPRKQKANQNIIAKASERIALIAGKIAKGEKFHRPFFWPNIIWSIPFGILYSIIGRRFIGKMLVVDSKCNSCKLCAKQCPVKAIDDSHSRIRWRLNCEGCLRCFNSCPKHAIQVSILRALFVFGATFINPLLLIPERIPVLLFQSLGNTWYVIFNTLIGLILTIVILVVLDWLIYMGSRVPIIGKIAALGHTKLYGRYHAKQFAGQFLNGKQDS
jgi:Pyruvate/2-oxoacid:ferredoxin oxidoreductase delta subunit